MHEKRYKEVYEEFETKILILIDSFTLSGLQQFAQKYSKVRKLNFLSIKDLYNSTV